VRDAQKQLIGAVGGDGGLMGVSGWRHHRVRGAAR
jgi:hypothetical protein